MTSKNFIIKNGLTIGTTEVLDSSGDLTAAAFGTAALEAIDDQVNTLLTAGTGVSLSYDDSAGTLTINGQQGDITGVNAGAGLTGTASSGDATLNIGEGTGITVNADDIAIDFKDEDDMSSNSATHAATQQSIKAYVDTQVATVPTGDITSVVSGAGLTGGGTSGDVTVNVVAGNGLIANANDVVIDTSITADLSTSQTFTNKTLTTPIINGTISGTAIKDEDNMASDSNTHLATQQSIKAYVDSSVAAKDNTDEITEGSSNLYFTNERVDDRVNGLLSAGVNVALSYDDANNDLEIRVPYENIQDTVGTQIASNGSHTGITATYDDAGDGAIDLAVSTSHIRGLISAGGDLSYDSSSGVISFTNDAGDISSVVAGTGMTGGGTSGDVTVNVIGGDGITANANDIALSSSVAGDGLSFSSGTLAVGVDDSSIEIDSDSLQVKAGGVTNAMLAGSIAAGKLAGSIGNSLLSNSAITIDGTSVSLGGSITTNNTVDMGDGFVIEDGDGTEVTITENKEVKFVEGGGIDINWTDTSTGSDGDPYDLTFTIADGGVTNDMLAGSIANSKLANNQLTVNSNTAALGGSITLDTDDVGEGSSNLYHTAARARAAISAGTGVGISSGEISIGQAVATNSNVQFANMTLSGNLTVNGSTVTNSASNTTIEDALIELGSGNSGSNSNDLGLILERGSTGDNGFIGFDESADQFVVATTTATGGSSGDLSLTDANFRANQITTSYANNSGGVVRNIYQNTSAPGASDGAVGDLWILYS